MPSPPDDSYEYLVLELSVDEIEDDDGEPEVAKGKETSEWIDDGVVGVDVEEAGEKPPGGEPRKEGGDEESWSIGPTQAGRQAGRRFKVYLSLQQLL